MTWDLVTAGLVGFIGGLAMAWAARVVAERIAEMDADGEWE